MPLKPLQLPDLHAVCKNILTPDGQKASPATSEWVCKLPYLSSTGLVGLLGQANSASHACANLGQSVGKRLMVADRDMHQPQSKSAKCSAAQGWRGNLGKQNLPRFICAAQAIATPWPACCAESITCNIRMSLQVALPVQHRVGGAAWASQFCIACMRQSWPICGQTAHGSWQGHASATKQVCQMFCSTGLAGQFGQTKSASLYLCRSNELVNAKFRRPGASFNKLILDLHLLKATRWFLVTRWSLGTRIAQGLPSSKEGIKKRALFELW